MPTINAMPTEILLNILEFHSFSCFDLLRISTTCWRWRSIIQTSSLLQERLWLRRKRLPGCSRMPKRRPDQFNINVLVRRIPATIWNDFEENIWEMSWCQDEEAKTIPWPRNPIVTDLENFLHIVSPHFVHQPPYKGCNVRVTTDTPLTLCFRSIKDLKAKADDIDVPMNESWREMLLSQHFIQNVGIKLEIDIRYGARDVRTLGHVLYDCIHEGCEDNDDDDVRMKDLVSGMQEGLVLIWQALKEQGFK